ncbi:MAG: M1 family aminopeptidase [Bacteroidales bacterium]|nr:M1 family aminopeptidase [Bacteroidales bacterium]
MTNRLTFLILPLLLSSCVSRIPEAGVPEPLAIERAASLSDLSYRIGFDLRCPAGEVVSSDTVSFDLRRRSDMFLDFKAVPGSLTRLRVNGKEIEPEVENEHVLLPRRLLNRGVNEVILDFMAGEHSLNRRNDFLYTLLVPDRARTLFPCFDQPDLKATYSLSLKVPDGWTAVSNSRIASSNPVEGGCALVFEPTEPLSTYLFSFVAGRFQRIESTRGGRTISMYHRETDPGRLAQCDEIFSLVFDSLDWLEDYTGMPYPFAKYDFVVLPDFQYGGMEHTGATLYNDRTIFFDTPPTTVQKLDRASLIAHETAHMWFGDCVTMRWFNDVWTKEVFANFFAAKMMRPQYPEVNHALSDLMNYYASAYSEDRTEGACAIQRPLDNLNHAGLIYCNTIYDKAPIVMNMLEDKVGEDCFKECIRELLRKFAYSNETWDDLVAIFDSHSDEDIESWSERWVKEPGMPEYEYEPDRADSLAEGKYWLPNLDGNEYGWFKPDQASMDYIMAHWREFDETARMSLLMTLYENSWHGLLDRRKFVLWCAGELCSESNPLILSSLIDYSLSEDFRLDSLLPEMSRALGDFAADASKPLETRLIALRNLFDCPADESQLSELFGIWKNIEPYPGLVLGEKDYTDLALQLMVQMPSEAESIRLEQRSRITNPDRLESFDFVSRAASPDPEVRAALFQHLLESPENRRPESRVLSALSLLCHRTRRDEAVRYVIPALEILPEIQATGDIFFPSRWCKAILENQHDNPEVSALTDSFLASHKDMNPLLVNKILQAR